MKILVCGMPRSMTTWTFNVIRELLAANRPRLFWIEPGSTDETEFARVEGVALAKCHHYSPVLANAAGLIVYSYRDLRTAAVSAYRKFGSTGSREQLETWIAVERLWLPISDAVLRYEDVERDPRAAAEQMAALVTSRAPAGVQVSRASAQEVLSRVEGAFGRDEQSTQEGFNPETLILRGHRTFQPAAQDLPAAEKEMYDRVERDFGPWLAAHHYLRGASPAAPPQQDDPIGAYLAALMREATSKEAVLMRANREWATAEAARAEAVLKLQAAEDNLEARQRQLEAKHVVLEETTRALDAYRQAFVLFRMLIVPVNFVAFRIIQPIFQWITGGFRPRLGVLRQHKPRPLRMPTPMIAAPRPAPRISIVTPSFGQARYIERTLLSVVRQDYPNLEYFVQDGGSKDGTVEILNRYSDRLAGWESKPDSGQSEAINRGFARTSGEIMAWLNSDDILFPGALAQVADFFVRHPEIDVVYGHRVLIDEEDGEVGRWLLPPHDDNVLSWADFIPQETLFWRRRIWDKVGATVDETFRFAMDWDLILRFRQHGARFARLPVFLGAFRVHAAQKTTAGISDIGFSEMDRLRKRTLGWVPSGAEVRKAVVPYLLRHSATHLGWRLRVRLGLAS